MEETHGNFHTLWTRQLKLVGAVRTTLTVTSTEAGFLYHSAMDFDDFL